MTGTMPAQLSTVVVHSQPQGGRYRDVHTTDGLGEQLRLPDPVGMVLDTGELKDLMP